MLSCQVGETRGMVQMNQTIEMPVTESTQCALNEATGHLYDALAQAAVEQGEPIPSEVFDSIEAFYVATAEETVANVEIHFDVE